jgi:ATP-binding cassette subfamily B protein IrtA
VKKKEKKKSSFAVLMHYAGGHKYYSYASAVLAVISAWIALIPFYDVWRIIKEILRVRPDFSKAENISRYGWGVCTSWNGVLYRCANVFSQGSVQGAG